MMKHRFWLILGLFLAPSLTFADPLGTLNRASDVLLSTQSGSSSVSLSTMTAGATNYAFNQDVLQPGASIYLNKATIQGALIVQQTATPGGGGGKLIFDPSNSGSTPNLQIIQNAGAAPAGSVLFGTDGGAGISTTAAFGAVSNGYAVRVATSGSSGYSVNRVRYQTSDPKIFYNENNNGFVQGQSSFTFDSGSDDIIADWQVDGQFRIFNGTFAVAENTILSTVSISGMVIDKNASPGTSGQVLTSNGIAPPTWQAASASGGTDNYPSTSPVISAGYMLVASTTNLTVQTSMYYMSSPSYAINSSTNLTVNGMVTVVGTSTGVSNMGGGMTFGFDALGDVVSSVTIIGANSVEMFKAYSPTGITISTKTVFTSSVTVGNGNAIGKIVAGSGTLDFANLAAIGCQDLTLTVSGAVDGDQTFIGVPNGSVPNVNTVFSGFVSAANTVTVRHCSYVVTGSDPASGTFRATVFHQ